MRQDLPMLEAWHSRKLRRWPPEFEERSAMPSSSDPPTALRFGAGPIRPTLAPLPKWRPESECRKRDMRGGR